MSVVSGYIFGARQVVELCSRPNSTPRSRSFSADYRGHRRQSTGKNRRLRSARQGRNLQHTNGLNRSMWSGRHKH